MKKIFALAAMVVMSLSAFAQNWYAGGEISWWRNATENQTDFSIVPEIGYNINEKWAVGTDIGYAYKYDNNVKTNLFVFDPYARFTYAKAGIVSFFCDGTVGIGLGKSKVGDYKSDTATTYQIGFRPGIAVNVSKNVSLVAHIGFLGYRGANDAAKDAGYSDCGGIRLSGNDLSFGFYYNF